MSLRRKRFDVLNEHERSDVLRPILMQKDSELSVSSCCLGRRRVVNRS